MFRKISTISLVLFFSLSLFVIASSTGKTGRTNLSDTPGCTCHGANPSANVSVVIEGPDTVDINSTHTYLVRISGGPAVSAGTNIAVSGGALAPLGSDLQLTSGELTHTAPASFGSGSEVVFQFEYTAPSGIGDITMAANGNSVNLNGANSGDQWNFAPNKVVSVRNASAIADVLERTPKNFRLDQNYPNPFNPKTTISYNLSTAGQLQLTVYNALGQKVKNLINGRQAAGNYSIDFDAANLPSGTYFYTLRVGTDLQTKRMTLKK